MEEKDFDPTTMTRATREDIYRIYIQLWGKPPVRKEDEMNGYTPTIEMQTRINNLLEQIPQEYRARACRECYGTDDFDFERRLTAYVLHRTWETYDHPVNEADAVSQYVGEVLAKGEQDAPDVFTDGFCDPRTPKEKEADLFAQEVEYTRLKDWDVTPTPNMPIIDFDNIDEIPF